MTYIEEIARMVEIGKPAEVEEYHGTSSTGSGELVKSR
jgi:hypothetical protein